MSTIPYETLKAAWESSHLLDVKINGRMLRDCTADDLLPHDGWLNNIGRKILRGHRKVGDVFSEAMLGWSFMLYHKTASELAEDVQWSKFRDSKPAPGDEFDEEEIDELIKSMRACR